ncbi:MAG: FAD:protein FMN transferase [Muribaculaceae bacterium]|nr:FAD:protein FMN transferase [Muribaculaceae bacterium]
MKKLYLFIFISSLCLCFSNCKNDNRKDYISEEGMVWNTQFHITFKGSPELKDSIRTVLEEVGHNLSVFDTTSLVSVVNRQDSTIVNSDFISVYNMSEKIYRLTDGMFDPTLSPLITAWGFGPGHKISSDTLKVDSILDFVGLKKTKLIDSLLIKENKRIEFNFSAIAKGYGCDRVAEMFKRNGVNDFLIEIGGEIVASGFNPHHSDWNISIDRPIISNSDVIHDSQVIISFTDMGLATSGNYRNYFENGSNRYGHTISPVTGRPVQTDVLSATVLSTSSMEADALATSFMALGSKKASELALRLKLPVMLILSDSVWVSPQFEKLIVK